MAIELWQARVVIEADKLKYKIARLTSFTETEEFGNLPEYDAGLLQEQLQIMQEYHEILIKRIETF